MQEVSIAKSNAVEAETDATMGLFPQAKYAGNCKIEGGNAVQELLTLLAHISDSEGPLRMQLPIPNSKSFEGPNVSPNNDLQY